MHFARLFAAVPGGGSRFVQTVTSGPVNRHVACACTLAARLWCPHRPVALKPARRPADTHAAPEHLAGSQGRHE
jgi:hypothetical protein